MNTETKKDRLRKDLTDYVFFSIFIDFLIKGGLDEKTEKVLGEMMQITVDRWYFLEEEINDCFSSLPSTICLSDVLHVLIGEDSISLPSLYTTEEEIIGFFISYSSNIVESFLLYIDGVDFLYSS